MSHQFGLHTSSMVEDLHCMNLEGLELAVPESVNPRHGSQAKVNDEIQYIIAIDLDAVSVVLCPSH